MNSLNSLTLHPLCSPRWSYAAGRPRRPANHSRSCATAREVRVRDWDAPISYHDSFTKQTSETRITFADGGVLGLLTAEPNSSWTADQKSQAERLKDTAREAYLPGSRLSTCTDTKTSPNTLWVIELCK